MAPSVLLYNQHVLSVRGTGTFNQRTVISCLIFYNKIGNTSSSPDYDGDDNSWFTCGKCTEKDFLNSPITSVEIVFKVQIKKKSESPETDNY